MNTRFTAFLLSPETRQALIGRFPPAWPQIKADHITYRFGEEGFGDLFHPQSVEITGIADDGNGLQTLLVRVDGQQFKPDGRPYHITWSLDPAKKAPDYYRKKGNYRSVHANDLAERILGGAPAPDDSFTPIAPPLKIDVTPARIEKDSRGRQSVTPLPPPGRNAGKPPVAPKI